MNGSIDQIINFLYTRLDSNQRFPFTIEIISNFISSVVLTDFLSKNMRKKQTESHSQVKLPHVFRQGHQCLNFFNDQCSHHTEISQLICRTNQLNGFYMMGTLVVKRIIIFSAYVHWSLVTCRRCLKKLAMLQNKTS